MGLWHGKVKWQTKEMKQICFVLFCLLSSCNSTTSEVSKAVTPNELQELLNQEHIQILDVRTPNEFQSGHIEGAININFYDLNFEDKLKALDANYPVVVYCKKGFRSAKVALILLKKDFKNIYDLEGGFDNWKTSNKTSH